MRICLIFNNEPIIEEFELRKTDKNKIINKINNIINFYFDI